MYRTLIEKEDNPTLSEQECPPYIGNTELDFFQKALPEITFSLLIKEIELS